MIRRLYCKKCRRLHNELPDILSPYKHYEAETIEGVVDDFVLPDDRQCHQLKICDSDGT